MDSENIDILKKLQNGETVECLECKKGYYAPHDNITDIKQCCHFKCNHCGNMVIATKRIKF